MDRLTVGIADEALGKVSTRFVELFQHGSLSVEYYRPAGHDPQTPHTRDEVYVVISGSGVFLRGETTHRFEPGEVIFVPAGMSHRFEEFTDDFATWVFFYGPEGGEPPNRE